MLQRIVIQISVILPLVATSPLLAMEPDLDFFEKKIRPVLVEHCYKCHSTGAKKIQGNLVLDSRKGVRRGGDSGPAVVPNNIDESLILGAIRYEDYEMPPSGQLPETVIADFETWIKMGAPDPRDATSIPVDDGPDKDVQDLWSLQPLKVPSRPSIHNSDWAFTEIDRFVLARLEKNGLQPTDDASKRTLIRRAYFDLLGLPPSSEEVEEFVHDDSPDAFVHLVDRLLESPHFGERWGRHWLDVVRFAESSGGGRTRVFDAAWRYRDYVIDSYNNDKPFDRFLAEQIAGDLLPYNSLAERNDNLTATGFLVLGPTNYELQDKELLRMEVVDEQIDTIGRTFLGMTIGCARCHDHKFDPVPTSDYYALAGIFRSTKTLIHANVSNFVERELPVDANHAQAIADYQKTVKPVQDKVNALSADLKNLQAQIGGDRNSYRVGELAGIVVDDADAQYSGSWSSSQSVGPFVEDGYRHAGAGSQTARFAVPVQKGGRFEVRLTYTAHPNRATNVPVTIHHTTGKVTRKVNQSRVPPIDGIAVSLGTYSFDADNHAIVEISTTDVDGVAIADAVQLLPADREGVISSLLEKEETSNDVDQKRTEQQIAAASRELKQLQTRLKSMQKQAPTPAPKVMSVEEESEPEDYNICIRGNVHNLGDSIARGYLSAIDSVEALPIPDAQSGRLQLTQWMTSPQHPLTARVYCNRVWHHLFGAGLVRTPDNFGSMGEQPSHPELLDWLAIRFMQQGWSTKTLIREMMLSRVYQLSSEQDTPAVQVDPENRFLSRMNRRRLEAEAIRDAILLISGQLDEESRGSAIPAGTKTEFGYEFRTLRRSVYVPVFRNTLHGLFEVFDFADPNIVVGRRNTSTLATQALYLMNSPFVLEQSRYAAERLLAVPDISRTERITIAHQRMLGRPPTDVELRLSLEYLEKSSSGQDDLARWTNLCQSLFSCIDFRYLE